MTAAMTVDAKDFHQALKEYAKVSSRDWATIANDKTRDLLFKAGKNAKVASAHDIRGIKKKESFLKMVATITAANRKSRSWKRDFARTLRGIIGKRVSATTYLRVGFYKAANRFMDSGQARRGKQKPQKGKRFTRSIRTTAKAAKPRSRAQAESEVLWTAADGIDKAGKERMARMAMDKARRIVGDDMRDYIIDKAKKAAAKYSAK